MEKLKGGKKGKGPKVKKNKKKEEAQKEELEQELKVKADESSGSIINFDEEEKDK